MLSFSSLKHLKRLTIGYVFIKYTLWYLFYVFQGKAINLAIDKKTLVQQLIYSLGTFIIIKLLVMVCDILHKFFSAYYKNNELKYQWEVNFPAIIHRDNRANKNQVNQLFFDYLPKIFDLEITSLTNKLTIFYIFTLVALVFIYSGFFVGIVALILVFILNYLSKNIFVDKLDSCQIEVNENNIKILNWVDQYFSSYKEISKNWKGIGKPAWRADVYKKYFLAKNRQSFLYLYRDLLSQILVELPFLLNTAVVIIAVFYSHLNFEQLFVWVGFSQFMIIASNAYLDNRVNKSQHAILSSTISAILAKFQDEISNDQTKNQQDKPVVAEIMLRDGTWNVLALAPGIYHIEGANGSGKSTLMNMLIDYEREYSIFANVKFLELKCHIKQEDIRLIEREAFMFDCFDDFNSQVCGPVGRDHPGWRVEINRVLNCLLQPSLAIKWMEIFLSLEAKYTERRNNSLSAGEKIVLSLMRFFSSWNESVNLIIVDECDSFLDHEMKSHFLVLIKSLSTRMAIYMSSHDQATRVALVDNRYLFKTVRSE